MAGDDAARGTKMDDSGGFSIALYADRYNAKYGKTGVKRFAKLHIIQTLDGKICSAMVTPGKANDSPYLRAMVAMMQNGSGHVLADAQYCGVENCQATKGSGRRWRGPAPCGGRRGRINPAASRVCPQDMFADATRPRRASGSGRGGRSRDVY